MRFGKLRLRAILALLVLTTSVPLGLFAGILIVRSSHEQRALVEQRNVETARAVSVAVDQHVESARAALQALAATDLLTNPQRITFNEAALRLVPTQPGWYAVLLVHPSGAVMADTALGDNDIPSFTTADWVQPRRRPPSCRRSPICSRTRRRAGTSSSSPCRSCAAAR